MRKDKKELSGCGYIVIALGLLSFIIIGLFIMLIIIFFEDFKEGFMEGYNEANYEYEEKLPYDEEKNQELVNWYNDTFFVVTIENDENPRIGFGGYTDSLEDKKTAIRKLYRLGIKNRYDLFDYYDYLLLGGTDEECMSLIESYGTNISDEDFLRRVNEDLGDDFPHLAQVLIIIKNTFGESGIIAYDLGRANQIVSWAYTAGYLTYDEALSMSLEASKNIQVFYDNWNDYFYSYLYGYLYEYDENPEDENSIFFSRLQIFEDYKDNFIDFNMDLEAYDIAYFDYYYEYYEDYDYDYDYYDDYEDYEDYEDYDEHITLSLTKK